MGVIINMDDMSEFCARGTKSSLLYALEMTVAALALKGRPVSEERRQHMVWQIERYFRPDPAPTNARFLASRNKREGYYAGRFNGRHWRANNR